MTHVVLSKLSDRQAQALGPPRRCHRPEVPVVTNAGDATTRSGRCYGFAGVSSHTECAAVGVAPMIPKRPAADPKPIRVMLVDDHQLLTDALSRVLTREPDIEVIAIAGTVEEARNLSRAPLDVVLMDYRLPDGTGAEATRWIKARSPATRIVMLTGLADDETILESIQAGADGYLTKGSVVEEVVSAVRAANAGETLLPRSVIITIAERVAAARDRGAERQRIEPLTPRELEVLRGLAKGLSSAEICAQLVIAPNTLRTHVQNLMTKLRVHTKLEAVAFGLRHGLVEPPKSGDASF